MTHRPLATRLAAALVVLSATAGAQDAPSSPGALPPIRPLGKITASSTELLTAVSQVRALPDGRVLVNDNGGRKVVLFDAALSTFTVVADTTSATANAYSSRAGGLIQYKGDSTLFVDPQALAMLVVDAHGDVKRVISVPRPGDANLLIGGPAGTPAFDAQGRLVYRSQPGIKLTLSPNPNGGQPIPHVEFPDSSAVVRVDLATRKLDTVALLKISKQNVSVGQSVEGRPTANVLINPMQYVDDWAVTADGRVAILRGHEYRVDWIGPDGQGAGTTKIPFQWRHLDDSSKSAFLDSTRAAMERLRAEAQRRIANGDAAGISAMAQSMMPGEAAFYGGLSQGQALAAAGAERAARAGAPAPAGAASAATGGRAGFQIPPLNYVSASELPDYAPPFAPGAMRGDADGNLWIRTTNVYNGGSVYDVVNAQGQLTDRVLLPAGRVIAGFAKGGIVYMGVRVTDAGVRLERATLK